MNNITLKEAKGILGIDDFSKDDYIQEMIPIATDYVKEYCGNPELEITSGVKLGIIKIIEFYMNNSGLQSRSLSRVNETFLTELPPSILILLEPYSTKNQVKFL